MYTASAFAKKVGVTVKTLQRWDRTGKLPAKRTQTNRRYYTEDDLCKVLKTPKAKPATICYCRVSSQAQRTDLKNQRRVMEEYVVSAGLSDVEIVEEIGGGLNFTRPKFLQLIFDICSGNVGMLVVAHKDRLCRFGFELIKQLCDHYGCELRVLDQTRLSPENEMVQDLMTIVHCFSSRLYGLRNYRKTLQEALRDK